VNRIESDILVIGGGAAGLSAAKSAAKASRSSVTLVDDNPKLGGQIWRAEKGVITHSAARGLVDALASLRVQVLQQTQVFASPLHNTLLSESPNGPTELTFRRLIIATGARELFLPFPDWTLPNVAGAGGLQALVKGGLDINRKRLVVSGTGPLLLAAAEFFRSKGADVIAIVEQAPARKIRNFAARLIGSPAKLGQGIQLRLKLFGTPYWTDSWVVSANGTNRLESVSILRKGERINLECDLLACGFHLIPNSELPALLGCRLKDGSVEVDEYQQTTVEGVYCAGEPTGIGGVELSLMEGTIAGLSAVGDLQGARAHFSHRKKLQEFAANLNRTFSLRDEVRYLANDVTIVCRCEDVEYGRLKNFTELRDAKLQTRCGMGACQGRVCGPATAFLFGWEQGSVRPPIFPVKMENL
jgi:NADPH-dependent 2,4-dienoyl-CoA reductase/sulfur reductase-like enzyme